jgi:KDO2-lipid IV(A) lauroyltransferase
LAIFENQMHIQLSNSEKNLLLCKIIFRKAIKFRKTMSALLYYLIVLPISYLPLGILYKFSDFLFFVFTRIFQYRKAVILGNIQRSFPNKTQAEQQQLVKDFYRHFADILVEGVKNLSISREQLKKRMLVRNPEIMNELYQEKRNVILVSGHFNNWEWLISAQNLLFKHQAFGIGMPMTNKFWDKKVNQRRERFGMQVINAANYQIKFRTFKKKPFAVLTLGDQSPANVSKSYWMNFLNQDTAVLFGTEHMANDYNFAVVFFVVHKIKRGYYEMELKLVTKNASAFEWGEITEIHTKLLEEEIVKNPAQWLWSHKRWKREVPQDLTTLKRKQKKQFEEKFRIQY